MTEADVFAALKARYGQEAVLVSQVSNATGARKSRTIDAVAIGVWPSRGLYLHAIEIKVSRSDLRRELDHPEKADAIAACCDAFFIAAPFDPTEGVPDAWGWYTVSAGSARKVRDAKPIEAAPLGRSFVAALARQLVAQCSPDAVMAKAREEGAKAARAEMAASNQQAWDDAMAARRELTAMQCSVRGVDVDAVQQMMAIARNFSGAYGSLNALRVNATEIVRQADAIETLSKRLMAVEREAAKVEEER